MLDHRPGLGARGVEQRSAFAGPPAHAGRVVEDHHRALRAAGHRRQVGADLGERARERERQRHRQAGPREQQQRVAQPPPRGDLALGAQQKLHRREADRPGAPPPDAVDDRRAGRRPAGRAAATVRGSASRYLRARWRAKRKARRTSAGGSAVVANRYSTRASRQMRRQRSRSAADSRSNEAARSRGSTSSRRRVVGLDRLEVGHLVERQRHLVGVEDLEQRHVVAARAELSQPIGQVGRRVEQIGEEHDQAPPIGQLGDVGERAPRLGAPRRVDGVERHQQIADVPSARARRQVLARLRVEHQEARRIPLLRQQVGERRRQVAGVGELGHPLAPVAHRRRRVERAGSVRISVSSSKRLR